VKHRIHGFLAATLALAFVAAVLVTGSCAPAGKAPRLSPQGAPTAASAPVPPLPEPPQPVVATAPAEVQPAAPPPVPVQVPAPVPDPALPRPFSGWVRIGLATDLESVTLPCCEGELSVDVGGTRLDVASPLRIAPAATSVSTATYRVQIAALKDEDQAKELARRLGALAALPADARFDAQAGIYRVRIGRFPRREAAEEAGRRLVRFGVDNSWIVSEGEGLGEPALDLTHRGKSYRVAGRSFVLAAPAAAAASTNSWVRWEGRRYRGRLVVYLNDRGRLNLVNELPIEQYLRGVVPRELGPGAYPEIEALKAQAIAARSYTLRNLGEFADEGYDLCGTPRCQVYGGMDDEHPLSDRAVAETAGEILLYDGQPIDALYSATCGGHTENVEVIFPLKRAPYLRGVPCIEAGEATLRNRAGAGPATLGIARLVLERAQPGITEQLATAAGLERAFARLAGAAGLEIPADHLASLDRREVQRFLGSTFDLAADARLFVRPEELGYLVANPPPEWNVEDRRLAAYLVESGLLAAPGAAETKLGANEAEELLYQLALFLRVLERREATFSRLTEGGTPELVARDDGAELHFALPGNLATYRREGGTTRAGDLVLEAGDALELYLVAGGIVAVAQEVDPRGASFDRTHNLSRWTRYRSDADLAASVAGRLPGFAFRSFEVLMRGVSGRVGKIRLLGRAGETAETVDVEGLAVRWTLDLPDTLFTARRLAPAQGEAGWQFSGRGWGHGVGLCQVGSYGMARRGHDYRAILGHYYGGARLQRIPYSSPGSIPPAAPASIAAPGAAR